MAGLGVEQSVISTFINALRETDEGLPAAVVAELEGHLASGGPDVKAVVEMVTRLAGDARV